MGGRTGNAGMQAKSNMTAMKGQLGLRSSALAPTSAKLTTQYLVLDHMTNHYSKIVNAKSAIDNRPPKVLATSQKARDRKTREYVKKTGVRPGSSMNVRPTSRNVYYDDMEGMDDHAELNDYDPEDDDDRLVLDIMKTTLKSNRQDRVESTEATYGGSQSYDVNNGQSQGQRQVQGQGQGQGNNYHSQGHSYQRPDSQGYLYQAYSHQPAGTSGYPRRPSSARSVRSTASGVSRSALAQGAIHNRKVEDGDILATRKHVFTEPEKPFTPRTLKSTRTSKLSQTKFYTAPPQNRKDQPGEKRSDKHFEESVEKPKPKPRRTKSPFDRTETPLTENSLMYETLQSRDFTKYNGKDKMVPALDISMDTDHLNWIKEQASKAEIRAKSSTLKSNMDRIKENDMLDTTDMGQTGELSTGSLGRTTRAFGTRTMGRSGRLNDQEEELQYVEFMKEVTDDVLNRGVFTNRVLKQVFQTHIEKRRGQLDEYKMRGVLDEIRRDLDIPNEPDSDPSSYTETPDTSSRLKSTGYTGRTNSLGISKPFERTFNSTMDSQNTYGLQSTSGDMFSTINSEFDKEDMSNTQALQSYQLEMTRKEAIDEGDEGVEDGVVEEATEEVVQGRTHQQPGGRVIQVNSRDTDNESVHSSVHSSSSKSRISRSKAGDITSAPSHEEVLDRASVHSQGSRTRLSAASRSRPSSVVSAASRSRPSSVVSAASQRPGSEVTAASHEQMVDNVSMHSHSSSRLKPASPPPRQYVDRYQDIVQSPQARSVASHGEETDDTLTHDHSQVLSEGETEGAYGEDEFEESEPDDQLATATHRTSDDDF